MRLYILKTLKFLFIYFASRIKISTSCSVSGYSVNNSSYSALDFLIPFIIDLINNNVAKTIAAGNP